MLKGSITALITPFRNGEIDRKAFDNLVEWQVQEGSHGVVPCGTTGESPVLTDDETRYIVERCVQIVNGRIPVIAGTGSNSTQKTIHTTQMAKAAGADAALIVTPYYNKPTQAGLVAHYTAIHNETDLPIVLYNVPGRCVVELAVDTVLRLAELPRIAALKDATADASRTTLIKSSLSKDFAIFSGEDALAGAYLAQGADGCISVTSNIAPAACADVQNAWNKGDMATFSTLQARLAPLHKALFCETSPSPVKYAASRLGLCSDEVRLPLVPASSTARKTVDEALLRSGLIDSSGSAKLRAHG